MSSEFDIIEIKLPKPLNEDIEPRKCYRCCGQMLHGITTGTYTYEGRKYRIRCMQVWKCFDCGELLLTSEEAKRVERAIDEKAKEFENESLEPV